MGDVVNSGNIIGVIKVKVMMAGTISAVGAYAAGSLVQPPCVPQLLWAYFLFHGTVCLICLTWSVFRLRIVALKQSYGKTEKLSWFKRFRPPVGELPVLWKELNIDGGLRINWLGWLFVILLGPAHVGHRRGSPVIDYFFWELLI